MKLKKILDKEYKCKTIIGKIWGESASGREVEAKLLDADLYLAIHSNAASTSSAIGTIGFYHPLQPKSKQLTTNIVSELNKINPTESNRYEQISDGMAQFDGYGFGEIRKPSNLGITSVLVETEFHTNPITADWIIKNRDEIARAYVKAIVKTYNLKKK